MQQADVREADVTYWTLSDGSHYVEFRCCYLRVEAVLIPDPCDWLLFYIGFVAPYLQAHATVSLSHQQNRIANVLTARARYGKGEHIDPNTGLSKLDRPWAAVHAAR